MDRRQDRSIFERPFIVGAPLCLAVLELFHPHPGNLLNLDVHRWLAVHYGQILLFPLSALAVARLVHRHLGVAAAICRLAMFIFAISYTAFDTAAGVVIGILVKAAQSSGNPEAWRPAIDTVWAHPIMGGAATSPAPLLAVLGAITLSIGTVAAAISLKRARAPWPPVALLAVSGFGISVFKTHAWPGGPLSFGGMAVAAAWLQWTNPRAQGRLEELRKVPPGSELGIVN